MILRTKAAQSAAIWAALALVGAAVVLFPFWSFPFFREEVDAEVVELNSSNHRSFEYRYRIGERTHTGKGTGAIGLTAYERLKSGFRFRAYYHPLLPFLSSPEIPSAPLGEIVVALLLSSVSGVWRFAYLGTRHAQKG